MTNLIELKNLTKRYGTVLAVDDVSMTVRKGEVLGFLGPNGAGKST
ncbi:MAG: ATP-binding cassette domain-containing protein, partial [Acetobacterales bacterium]